jgi:hypothetical protein
VFENRVLRRISGPKMGKVSDNRESLRVRSFIICTHPQIPLGRSVNANEVGGTYGTYARGEKSVQGFGMKARRKESTWKTEA